mmetsp:Transcript_15379/g.50303  ORF Transcript_15379/g.50303 Transcript_15379/m.50303 type:complete len:203 (-) Transcript_15379:320-928(-)
MARTKPRSLWTRAHFLRSVGVNLAKTAAAARTYCVRAGRASTADKVASQWARGGSREARLGETRSFFFFLPPPGDADSSTTTTCPRALASASIATRTSTCVCVAATRSTRGWDLATTEAALALAAASASAAHSLSRSAAKTTASSKVRGLTSTKAPLSTARRFVSSHSARREPRFADSGATTKTTHRVSPGGGAKGPTSTPS